MYMQTISSTLVAASFLLVGIHPATSSETIVAEDACKMDGYSRPLRQTIVVIDQLGVDAWKGGDLSEKNRRWINAVVSLAGVEEGQTNTNAAPRERITILVAKYDGSDLLRVFTGCPPTFSDSEIDQVMKGTEGFRRRFDQWLGNDPKSKLEITKREFRTKLLGALVGIAKEAPPAPKVEKSSFLKLLPEVGRSFDVGNGIPRIVILSPVKLKIEHASDRKSAREAGFRDAVALRADLKRAELYVVRGKTDSESTEADYLASLFLGAKAHLVAVSGETLPNLQEPPEKMAVFGGATDYGQVKAPMQVRVAVDRTGALVNSWVEVTVERPVATPLTGKAICKSKGLEDCEIKGDGKEFAQAWVADPDPSKPTFDEKLPFSGLRWFEFTSSQTGVSGRFYDPMVIINKEKEIPVQLSKTPDIKF
jgi:hypothetical protein